MPPDVRATASGQAASGAGASLTVPSSTTSSDWLVFIAASDSGTNSAPSPTVASGGGSLGTVTGQSGTDCFVYRAARQATAGDASQSLTWTCLGGHIGLLIVVQDTDALDNASGATWATASTTHPQSNVAVTDNDSLALAYYLLDSSSASSNPYTGAGGSWSAVVEEPCEAPGTTGDPSRLAFLLEKATVASGTLTGPTATPFQGQEGGGFTIVMSPVAGGGPDMTPKSARPGMFDPHLRPNMWF